MLLSEEQLISAVGKYARGEATTKSLKNFYFSELEADGKLPEGKTPKEIKEQLGRELQRANPRNTSRFRKKYHHVLEAALRDFRWGLQELNLMRRSGYLEHLEARLSALGFAIDLMQKKIEEHAEKVFDKAAESPKDFASLVNVFSRFSSEYIVVSNEYFRLTHVPNPDDDNDDDT